VGRTHRCRRGATHETRPWPCRQAAGADARHGSRDKGSSAYGPSPSPHGRAAAARSLQANEMRASEENKPCWGQHPPPPPEDFTYANRILVRTEMWFFCPPRKLSRAAVPAADRSAHERGWTNIGNAKATAKGRRGLKVSLGGRPEKREAAQPLGKRNSSKGRQADVNPPQTSSSLLTEPGSRVTDCQWELAESLAVLHARSGHRR
jgi:hypothetical protein